MFKKGLLLTCLSLAGCLVVSAAVAAPPKTKTKPKPKTEQKLGSATSTQLPGQWCDFNKNYTLGKTDPVNFCLKSAEYRVTRIKTDDVYKWGHASRKLLVLHGTVQNSQQNDRWFSHGSIQFTAVDGDSQNAEPIYIALEGSAKKADQSMKPAQKLDVFIVFDVTGKGEIPKLMASNGSEPTAPVARYDLRGKVKALEDFVKDPADKTGSTALEEIKAVVAKDYELGDYNIKVASVEFSDKSFTEDPVQEGYVSVVVTYEVANFSEGKLYLSGTNGFFDDKLSDADGATYDAYVRCLAASTDREISFEIDQGKTAKFRRTYQVPKGVKLSDLKISATEVRTLVFDLSTYKAP